MAKSKTKSVIAFIKKHKGKASKVAKKSIRKAAWNPKAALMSAATAQAKELAVTLGPTLAAYVTARIVTRVIKNVVGSRIPFLGKHSGPVANILLLVGTGYATGRSKSLKRYRTQIMTGLAISALQSLMKNYLPGLGRLLDESPMAPSKVDALAGMGDSMSMTLSGVPGRRGNVADDGDDDENVISDRDISWNDPNRLGPSVDGASEDELYTGAFSR